MASTIPHRSLRLLCAAGVAALLMALAGAAWAADAPVPLIAKNKPVDWWFVFKFNSKEPFSGCGPGSRDQTCPFDPDPGSVRLGRGAHFSQQYAFASSASGKLNMGKQCLGMTEDDPVGATFSKIYNGDYFYVVWNDQFYNDPKIKACGKGCGHSKGILAWNEAGDGLVMQVSTPSWPGSGNKDFPRRLGNTLGCIAKPNNLIYSQHFFALKLNRDGVGKVLDALINASVGTDPKKPQIVRQGGPPEIVAKVKKLATKSKSEAILQVRLTPDVTLISKPARLLVPPWQMVSALIDSADERVASWWSRNKIDTTKRNTPVTCWDGSELQSKKAGAVVIAATGHWKITVAGHVRDEAIKLTGGNNHAKIGVTTSGGKKFTIFGDLNQEGTLKPVVGDCGVSQNARGGLFFIVENHDDLFNTVTDLLEGKDGHAN
jgi:Deoxyribonuclease II